MKKPTILQVIPKLKTGGVERGTIEIAHAISDKGWNSIIASEKGDLLGGVRRSNSIHIELPLTSKNPFIIYANVNRLVRVIKEHNIDIIHARSRAPAWSAFIAARKTKTKFVTSFHGSYNIDFLGKRFYNSVMTKGDIVIAVSDYIKQHIIENYKCAEEKIRVIKRGVNLAEFSKNTFSPERLGKLMSDWRINNESLPIILCPSRITSWKGQHVLLKSLAKMQNQKFYCVLLGNDGESENYMKKIKSLIIKLGIQENIRIVPATAFMAEAYTLSFIVVAPSVEPEAFGRVAIEAQAMGKIIIASNHGGFSETIQNGKNGFLFDNGDVDSLYQIIKKMFELKDDERGEIETRATINAKKYYDIRLMQKKTLDIYEELLS